MLRCDELTERVTDYLEGQLSLANEVDTFLHLRRCSDCRKYLAQMKTTVRLLRQLPTPPSPTEVADQLLARFRRARFTGPVAHLPKGGGLGLVIAEARAGKLSRTATPVTLARVFRFSFDRFFPALRRRSRDSVLFHLMDERGPLESKLCRCPGRSPNYPANRLQGF
jgi:anti-sigma factor RsiW